MFAEPSTWLLLMSVLLTGAAAIADLRTGLIPNRLVAAGAGGATLLALAFALPGGVGSAAQALLMMVAGAVLVSLAPGILYRLQGIGGGDVKLLAVVGAALGPYLGLEAELYAFAALLLYTPLHLVRQGTLRQTLRNSAMLLVRPFLRDEQRATVATSEMTALRFGPAIFAGTLAVACHHLWNLV